jgi:WhiB family redox-sensing transcriptional regulator
MITPLTARQRVHRQTRLIRKQLARIEERVEAADASTMAPPRTAGARDRVSTSSYADSTAATVTDRDQLLGQVEREVDEAIAWAEEAAAKLSMFAAPLPPELVCSCPAGCCPEGCGRPRVDHGAEHPTCRARRSRARRRGDSWAVSVEERTAETAAAPGAPEVSEPGQFTRGDDPPPRTDATAAPPEGWATQAACIDLDTDLFFALATAADAVAVCNACDVRVACLEHAVATNERHGIRGGLTPEQRQAWADGLELPPIPAPHTCDVDGCQRAVTGAGPCDAERVEVEEPTTVPPAAEEPAPTCLHCDRSLAHKRAGTVYCGPLCRDRYQREHAATSAAS